MAWLNDAIFSSIVANTPLISIDLVVKNGRGEILLGLRTNRPAQGMWFVPGGRICKDEPISDAFLRLTCEELGVALPIDKGQFLGVYEHFYPDNFSGDEFSTHYVVLGYQIALDLTLDQLPRAQHEGYRWWKVSALLQSERVHIHSKWYFDRQQVGIKSDHTV